MKASEIKDMIYMGMMPSGLFTSLILMFHWGIYQNEFMRNNFNNFFNTNMKPFNPFHYILLFIILELLFCIIFKSDFKEEI